MHDSDSYIDGEDSDISYVIGEGYSHSDSLLFDEESSYYKSNSLNNSNYPFRI